MIHPLVRYGASIVAVALAMTATLLLTPMHQSPFALFFPAVLAMAWWAGKGPGLLAVILSAGVLLCFFLGPINSSADGLGEALRVSVFVAVAAWANALVGERRQVEQSLQQQAAKLAESEARLRHSEQELADFFNNGALGLHWVGPDGIIVRANQAELDLLGYTREEYVGRHIANFHADKEVIDDILQRLQAGDTLHNYEARLRCKDGSIKHVLISSNVLWRDGQFVHTRCFTRDITDRKRVEEMLRKAHDELERRVEQRTAELSGQRTPPGRDQGAPAGGTGVAGQ